MTVTTVDHAPSLPEAPTTLWPMPDAPYPSAGRGHIRHDAQVDYEPRNPVPDPGASVRYAALLYEITGWEIFSYAALAASESPEEADERRRIHRRRQPPWAGED